MEREIVVIVDEIGEKMTPEATSNGGLQPALGSR